MRRAANPFASNHSSNYGSWYDQSHCRQEKEQALFARLRYNINFSSGTVRRLHVNGSKLNINSVSNAKRVSAIEDKINAIKRKKLAGGKRADGSIRAAGEQ